MEATATDVSRSGSVQVFNLFVRLLDGKTLALKLTSPSVRGHALKHRLFETTGIPPNHQRLVTGVRPIEDDSVISCSGEASGKFPTVHLLLRLLGGKGGFGSLLRGAATKAGQKKTNNFDACRDMSGRRLRHVNAEKRLEEWKAEEGERRLEKVAEEFLKKKSKVGKKGVGDSAAQKYVDKYREESARCVAGVEDSVRDAAMKGGNGKRKGGLKPNGANTKKLKIWMGKRIMGESDSDNSDDEDGTEDIEKIEKLVILSGDCQSDLNKDSKRSLNYVNFGKHGDGSGGVSCEGGSEEEKNMAVQETMELIGSSIEKALFPERVDEVEPCSKAIGVSAYEEDEVIKQDPHEFEIGNKVNLAADPQNISGTNNDGIMENSPRLPEPNGSPLSKWSDHEETSSSTSGSVIGIYFDDFISAAEMEYLGLERLQIVLKLRGLNYEGTLQELATRLFQLKCSHERPNNDLYECMGWFPKKKLPLKVLARKRKGSEGSSDSVNFCKHGDCSGGVSCESGSQEEKNMAVQETVELIGSSIKKALCPEQVDEVEPCSKAVGVSAHEEDEVIKQDPHEFEIANRVNVAADPQNISGSNNDEIMENLPTLPEPNGSPLSKWSDHEETSSSTSGSVIGIYFDDFISAAEMEYIGLERLQIVLKLRGLNYEGTLQELATRLFQLKCSHERPNNELYECMGWFPKKKLPLKVLARKRKGSDRSSDSVNFCKHGDGSGGVSCESGSQEEKNMAVQETVELIGSSIKKALYPEWVEPCCSKAVGVSAAYEEAEVIKQDPHEFEIANRVNVAADPQNISGTNNDGIIGNSPRLPESNGSPLSNWSDHGETSSSTSGSVIGIYFDDFISAAEMEYIGLERLQIVLKLRGLNYEGTLQELATRLFQLKCSHERPNNGLYECMGWFPKKKLPLKVLARKRKGSEGSSDSVNFCKHGDGSGGVSCESGSQEEKNIAVQETVELIGSSIKKALCPEWVEPCCSKAVGVSAYEEAEVIKQDPHEFEIANRVNVPADPQNISGTNNDGIIENSSRLPESNGSPLNNWSDHGETSSSTSGSVIGIYFDDFISAAEMEYLGLERLQIELKLRGLNYEGTLQELATRLFQLKYPPSCEHPNKDVFEGLGWFPKKKLPKKFLARKRNGGFMVNGADAKKLKICESDNWDEEDGNKDKDVEVSSDSVNGSSGGSCESGSPDEITSVSTSDTLVALCIDDFSCAADMECLGLERLKMELKIRGLKCGGTLKERAARLFLLKSIPLDKFPKKHFAKK